MSLVDIFTTLAAAFALAGGGVIAFGLFHLFKYYWRAWRRRRALRTNLPAARPKPSPSPHDSPAAEIRKARNLLLALLVVAGLVWLRHLNAVPYRLKVYDENNRIETVVDWLGSYYRPIKEGEDVGQGVRYHSLQDAELAYERNDSPRVIAQRARVAEGQGPFSDVDVGRFVLRNSGYNDAQINALTDDQIRALCAKTIRPRPADLRQESPKQ